MLKRIGLFAVLFMLIFGTSLCWASTTKVLDQDTDLHPQGWAAKSLRFKGGTSVELNERGEVISGILKNYENLRPIGRGTTGFGSWGTPSYGGYLSFKGDDSITTFDEFGYVTSGTIGEDADIYIVRNKEPYVNFKFGTVIKFDKDGNLLSGTLKNDTYFRPIGYQMSSNTDAGFIKFKGYTQVKLNNGEVISGTLAEEIKLNTINGVKTFEANRFVEFDVNGYAK